MKTPHSSDGFSLVEICISVVILAILSILGFSVIQKAKEQSGTMACLGNLRAWGVVIAAYSADNRNELPRDQFPRDRSDPASKRISFYTALAPYGNYTYPAGSTGYKGTILACPAATISELQEKTCYALNIDLNYRVQEDNGYGYVTLIRTTDLQNASQYVLLSDALGTTILYTASKAKFEGTTKGNLRHGKKPNFLYADGHAAPFTKEFCGYNDAEGKTPFLRNLFFANGIDPYSRARQSAPPSAP